MNNRSLSTAILSLTDGVGFFYAVSANATGYFTNSIYQYTENSSGPARIAKLGLTVQFYIATGLASGKVYCLWLTYTKNDNTSSNSIILSAIPKLSFDSKVSLRVDISGLATK